MKANKFMALLLVFCLLLALTACGGSSSSNSNSDSSGNSITGEDETSDTGDTEEVEDIGDTSDTEAPVESEDTEEPDTEEEFDPSGEDESPWISGSYTDFDHMSFWFHGAEFTMGQFTLGELLAVADLYYNTGDGSSIVDAEEENIDPNSTDFRVFNLDSMTFLVRFCNASDEVKSNLDCAVYGVHFTLYDDTSDDEIRFAFPLDVTAEEIIANAGEPTSGSAESSWIEYAYDVQEVGTYYITICFDEGGVWDVDITIPY